MIDSHAHVSSPQFDADRPAAAVRARAAGVRWLEIGTDTAGSRRALALAEEFSADILGATVGVHPSDIAGLTAEDWSALAELTTHPRTLAVGEVGLDYHHSFNREEQLATLDRFVTMSAEAKLPIVWHVRSGKEADAHADMIAFLQGLPPERRPRGVMHTFSGTWAQAEEYLVLGLYLSLSGVVTYKNAPDMQETARRAPLERLLLETDCPYLTPDPFRGKRNEPTYVQYVAAKIADLRSLSAEEVASATEKNTLTLFKKS